MVGAVRATAAVYKDDADLEVAPDERWSNASKCTDWLKEMMITSTSQLTSNKMIYRYPINTTDGAAEAGLTQQRPFVALATQRGMWYPVALYVEYIAGIAFQSHSLFVNWLLNFHNCSMHTLTRH
jgi:hypothetical protein